MTHILDFMEYNTKRSNLIYKEYGRHIQKLVEHSVTVEDDAKRNDIILVIIDLMGTLNPHLKNVDDFKHKLWDHLHILSDFKLKVDSLYPIPSKEELAKKPNHIGYPKKKIQYKHYGKNVEYLIAKAVAMEDEEKQKEFAECIGNYMKLVYQNWNKDNVSNDTIIQDLLTMSDQKLKLDQEEINLDSLSRSTRRKKRPTNSKSKTGGYKKPGNYNKKRPRTKR